jgi:hypothetical protein
VLRSSRPALTRGKQRALHRGVARPKHDAGARAHTLAQSRCRYRTIKGVAHGACRRFHGRALLLASNNFIHLRCRHLPATEALIDSHAHAGTRTQLPARAQRQQPRTASAAAEVQSTWRRGFLSLPSGPESFARTSLASRATPPAPPAPALADSPSQKDVEGAPFRGNPGGGFRLLHAITCRHIIDVEDCRGGLAFLDACPLFPIPNSSAHHPPPPKSTPT